jgi:hypothetical protein
LSYVLLLIGNVTYFSDYLLKAGTVTVLALQSPNLCPLHLPGHLLVEGEVDCETLWNSNGLDQYLWQFVFSVNCLLPSLGCLIIAPSEVLFIMVVPILASGDRYLIPFDIWWGGLYVIGCTILFLMAILVDQKSTVITDIFAPSPGPTGLPNIQVFCLDDSI